ncbi:2-aminoadipate transaminase [compost metagenome]
MRSQYARGLEQMVDWVTRYFPTGTRISQPRGGFMLWIELATGFDSQRLNRLLLPHKVQIAPGSIFSAAGKYRNCLRINYAAKPSAQLEEAVHRVGESVAELLAELDPPSQGSRQS